MGNVSTGSKSVVQSSMEAVVLRCNCGAAPGTHFGAQCPSPLRIPYGTVAYWHRNPLKRLWYLFYRKMKPSGLFWKA